MYEPLEPVGGDFCDLRKLLADPAAKPRVDAIRAALDATALQLSESQGTTEMDRDNLAKLYRGFVAASRVIDHLQEKQNEANA